MRSLHVVSTLSLLVVPLAAADIYVPDQHASIQAAIDAAAPGDTVIVRPGTYVENLSFKGKAITVRSEQGAAVTVVDGSSPTVPFYGSVVVFENGEGPASVIEGFTLTGGIGTAYDWRYGGGISCKSGASPTIRNNVITGNGSDRGGGICLRGGSSPRIEGNEISNNVATQEGGGIRAFFNNSSVIRDNAIVGNWAGYGGGGIVFNSGGTPVVRDNLIANNFASYAGGGVSCEYDVLATFERNVIAENFAWYEGGGINCEFYADGKGVRVENNVFYKNTSGYTGGGMNVSKGGDCTLRNNTFVANQTLGSTNAGGLYCGEWTDTLVENCVFWGNLPEAIGTNISMDALSVSYCNVEQPWPGAGNLSVAPKFADLAAGDLRLAPGSPCIDAGSNALVSAGVATDVAGDPRFRDDPVVLDTGVGPAPVVDIGAYEFQPVQALEVVRLGTPPNPAALLPGLTSGPVLGATWDPVIDHASFEPSALFDFLALGGQQTNIPSGIGTILCGLAPFAVLTASPGAGFAVPIPSHAPSLGLQVTAQGCCMTAVGGLALTNALDLTLGSY